MATKRITRRYKNKLGQWITKEYEYDASKYAKRKGLKLVAKTKDGKTYVKKSNVEKVKKEIMANDAYTDAEKDFLTKDLEALAEAKAAHGETLTSNGFYGRMAGDPIDRLFQNMGRSTEEAALALGVSEEILRNEENWLGDVFVDPSTGAAYTIIFQYTGSFFRR